METADDTQLVREVLAGQTERFRCLVERYQTSVARIIGNLVPDRHEAEDIAQETFVAAYSNLARFDSSRAAFSTWLLTIARNRCVNWLKRRRPATGGELAETPSSDAADTATLSREFFERLDRALMTLPLTQRTVFVLAEIEQLSQAEIARIEDTTIGTVKSRLHRAKQRLQATLEPAMRETT